MLYEVLGVMAGFSPAIHDFRAYSGEVVDTRHKGGHDDSASLQPFRQVILLRQHRICKRSGNRFA
ncbi:MAG: hypothetical protein FD175_2822 [Beijerinckiaceae bacterium]|nr:MAG: hypothetical protein FD175_2822 [Beijerinckiaceae bacterium]